MERGRPWGPGMLGAGVRVSRAGVQTIEIACKARGDRGRVEILRILGCFALRWDPSHVSSWDPENLDVRGQVEILRILKCQRLES